MPSFGTQYEFFGMFELNQVVVYFGVQMLKFQSAVVRSVSQEKETFV